MRAALTIILLLGWAAGGTLAQPAPAPPPAAAAAPPGAAAKSRQPGAEKGLESESLMSCLAMWEATTHMSKPEWARACRRVDERLRTLSVK
jgi:hypothetical protein